MPFCLPSVRFFDFRDFYEIPNSHSSGAPKVRSLGPDVRPWVPPTPCVNLTDVTLADEDNNSILTDNANRAIQGKCSNASSAIWWLTLECKWRQLMTKFWTNAIWWPNLQLMQVVPSGGQFCNSCKWLNLVGKFVTNASGAIWWLNLQPMQVAPSGGQIWN